MASLNDYRVGEMTDAEINNLVAEVDTIKRYVSQDAPAGLFSVYNEQAIKLKEPEMLLQGFKMWRDNWLKRKNESADNGTWKRIKLKFLGELSSKSALTN